MPSDRHETYKKLLERMIDTLTEEPHLPAKSFMATTLKCADLGYGAKPAHALGNPMHGHTLWWFGLVWTLVVIALSATPSPTARLAPAEAAPSTQGAPQAAQRPAPEVRRPDGSRPVSGDRTHEETIQLNFRNVDILQMITLMSELTGKNFLVDDKVRGKVTLIAPQPVTRAEAYHIFLAALAMQGFTVVSQGPISTIVPSRDAKTSPLPTVTAPARPHQ
jgi:hypothetical protein